MIKVALPSAVEVVGNDFCLQSKREKDLGKRKALLKNLESLRVREHENSLLALEIQADREKRSDRGKRKKGGRRLLFSII